MTPGARRSGLILATLLALALLWWNWPSNPISEVNFTLIDGRQLRAEQLLGKPVLVTFWATSCPSCLQEMPDLIALHNDYAGRGLTLIGVAMPYDPPNRVVDYARSRQLPYAIALDLDAQLVLAFGDVRLTPTNILVGPDGRIVDRQTGRLDPQRIRRLIEPLLEGG